MPISDKEFDRKNVVYGLTQTIQLRYEDDKQDS